MSSSRQYLRVEGDAVHVVTERIERTVRLSDLLAESAKELGVVTPILPAGCRMFRQQGSRTTFVIEQVPQVRQLNWRSMDNGEVWKLAFPYVVFVVVFSGDVVDTGSCRVFYRNSPLNGDDTLCRTNLCNVYQDGRICTGSMRVTGDSLAQKAESFVGGFWRSQFNSDLGDQSWGPAARKFPQVKSLAAWQEESAKNPLFPLGIQWLEAGRLADVLDGRV